MKTAAIYTRQSTAEQKESRRVQEDEARRYATEIGVTVVQVFEDDAVSRAEYKKRPGLARMLAEADKKKDRAFDAIIMRDVDRLGGNTLRNTAILAKLIERKVEVHEYMKRSVVKMTTPMDKMVAVLWGFVAEIEREKTSARTRENHVNKARRGLVTGGRVYGYSNVRDDNGVHHAIHEEEAKIVVEIFKRYANGEGLRAIAHDLNARGIPGPRRHWNPNGIQAMVRNERYTGRQIWGTWRKGYRDETEVRDRQEPELVAEAPHLRIVDKRLWNAVVKRIERHVKLGVGKGLTPRPVQIPTMLGGLLTCGECGGRIGVERRVWGSRKAGQPRKSMLLYCCQTHRRAGPSVCSNAARRPVEVVDTLMAKWVRSHIFVPSFVDECLKDIRVRIKAQRKDTGPAVTEWTKEAAKLKREVEKLAASILSTGAKPDAIVRMIAEREVKLQDLENRIAAAKVAPHLIDMEVERMAKVAVDRVTTMRESWPWSPEAGRNLMTGLLDGRLVVTPTADGRFKLSGRISVSDCDPIDAEDGRPIKAAKMTGLTRALKSGEHTQDHVCSPSRPRRDLAGSTHGPPAISCPVALVA